MPGSVVSPSPNPEDEPRQRENRRQQKNQDAEIRCYVDDAGHEAALSGKFLLQGYQQEVTARSRKKDDRQPSRMNGPLHS